MKLNLKDYDIPGAMGPADADDLIDSLDDEAHVSTIHRELVIEKKTGRVRQAGTVGDGKEQRYVQAKRLKSERDLYYFLRVVYNMHWLQPELHVSVCRWLQTIPPISKFLLMPRNHCKSTIVAQGIPLHMLAQPKDHNVYFPNLQGCDTRILMVGENEDRIRDHYRPVKEALEGNELLRAWWPHLVWENPNRDAGSWNQTDLIVPRNDRYADPSIRAIGVGGATTGSHPNAMIKDDLTTERAMREASTMFKAIEWHKNSRALFEDPMRRLEFLTGTRWAVNDVAGHVLDYDAQTAVNTRWRTMIEDGQVIYPLKFGTDPELAWQNALSQYDGDFVMASLQYMNSVVQAGITAFDECDLRSFCIEGAEFVFDEMDADERLQQEINAPASRRAQPRRAGQPEYESVEDFRGKLLSDPKVVSALRMRYLRAVRSA
jgi:hypothetical protein